MKRREFIGGSMIAAGALALDLRTSEARTIVPVRTPKILRNVRIVDVEAGRTDGELSDIKIFEGKIGAIDRAGAIPADGLEIVDCKGKFATPGLIDCHAHTCGIFMTSLPTPADLLWVNKQIDLNYRAHLKAGVTTFRDMTAPLKMILKMRAKTENVFSGYPRLVCSGPMFTVAGGYPPHVPPDMSWVRALFGPLRIELENANDAAYWVDYCADAGVDWIKIGHAEARFDAQRTPLKKLSPELFRAVVERAHKRNLPVAVHHSWYNDLVELVDLPFDTLEHLSGDANVAPEVVEKMAARKLLVTTDIEVYGFLETPEKHLAKIEAGTAPLLPKPKKCMTELLHKIEAGEDVLVGKPPVPLFSLKTLKGTVAMKSKNLKALSDGGVAIGSATDAGTNLFFGSLPDEMVSMGKAGLSNAAVLRAATSDAARLLRLEDLGEIRKGRIADIVLYDEDPIANIEAVTKPLAVFRSGEPVFAG